jgi:hypothetical protein
LGIAFRIGIVFPLVRSHFYLDVTHSRPAIDIKAQVFANAIQQGSFAAAVDSGDDVKPRAEMDGNPENRRS